MNLKENPHQLFVIGGGASLKQGISKGLWQKLVGKYTIGCNYSYKYFDSTILTYVDGTEQKDFYNQERENLKNLPLIIGHTVPKPLPNTITISGNNPHYSRDLKGGCYKYSLCGLYALSLGIWLLDEGEIFLLGMDFGELRKKDYEKFATSPKELHDLSFKDKNGKFLTHFYQEEFNHRGIGEVTHFNCKGRVEENYSPYKNEKKCKIYNVSLVSKIPEDIFEKISYDRFFELLDKEIYNQEDLRKEIKEKIIKELDPHIITYQK